MFIGRRLFSSNTMNFSKFELLVLGGGSGGIACARRAAELGAKVGLIENENLGGTCVNVGCVPKKMSYNCAIHFEYLKNMSGYGFEVELKSVNWRDFKKKRDYYIRHLNDIYYSNLRKSGVEIIKGEGKFVSKSILEVNDNKYSAEHIVIATGGYPLLPNLPGAELGITSDGFFQLERIPRSIMIVGAGYIAVELCGILKAFGSDVYLAIRGEQVLRTFDSMISQVVTEEIEKSGVHVIKNSLVNSVQRISDKFRVVLSNNRQVDVENVLWAIGRVPKTDFGIEKSDISLDTAGYIKVDDYQKTTQNRIYALGDVCGKWLLTPVAIAAGRRLAVRLFGNDPNSILEYSNIPSVVFSHPPAATVGLTEGSGPTKSIASISKC